MAGDPSAATPPLAVLPPLVEPGPELSGHEVQLYSRQLLLPDVGIIGQRRLRNARVLVIGAGGLGSPALLYLAAAGVGTLGILDSDTVEVSNLQRQVVHGPDDVGRRKVESAAEAVHRVNPRVATRLHGERLDSGNALEILADYDLVLDGTDTFATRYLVNDACVLLGKPYVWGSVLRFEGQASVFWAAHGPQYRDLHPAPPPPGSVPSCAEGGVLGMVCATIGSVMSTEALKLITGIGRPLLGRVLVYDALEASFRTITLRPDPRAESITHLINYEAFCGTANADATLAANGHSVTAVDLEARRAAGEDLLLVDVREPAERAIVSIPGSILVPKEQIDSGAALSTLPRDRPVVLFCKSGIRSAEALATLHRAGFGDVEHLAGGILAWVAEVDPSLPTY